MAVLNGKRIRVPDERLREGNFAGYIDGRAFLFHRAPLPREFIWRLETEEPAADAPDFGHDWAGNMMLEAMSAGRGMGVGDILKVVEPLAGCAPMVKYDAVYELLEEFMRGKKIRRYTEPVEGPEGSRGIRFLHRAV